MEAFSVKEGREIRDRVTTHLGVVETRKGASFEVGSEAKDDDDDEDDE